jgi:hypothetical protein
MSFAQTAESQGAAEKPTLFCAGTVSLIEPPEPTSAKTQEYAPYLTHTLSVHFEPEASGQKARTRLRFNPEWLVAGFKPASQKAVFIADYGNEAGAKLYDKFIKDYQSNIIGSAPGQQGFGISLLQAICGLAEDNTENINVIAARIQEAEEVTAESVYDVLNTALQAGEIGQGLGYILQQQRVNTGQLTEDGKQIWVPGPYYEVRSNLSGFGAGVFYLTTANIASLEKLANNTKYAGRYQLTFGGPQPF